MHPADFIGSVFSGVESGYITLARFGGNGLLSTRIPIGSDLSAVNAYVEQYRETLYYNIAVGRENLPEHVRGSKSSLSAACMLWADVDLPKADSEKKYPTFEAIMSALDDMPLRPSILVNTGGGYHVYWLFNEPYEFGSIEQVQEFESKYSKPWQDLLRVKLAKYGDFVIDSTHDATRMLRIPGSWHKNGRQCVIEEADYSIRYGREDFEQFLVMIRPETLIPQCEVKIHGDITGLVDHNRLDALLHNSPEFRKVWDRKKVFDSNSETDASLAYHGVTAGWTDAEIANLIVAYNRKYQIDRTDRTGKDKMNRVDYLTRTISKIRSTRNRDQALLDLDDDEYTSTSGVNNSDGHTAPGASDCSTTVDASGPEAEVVQETDEAKKQDYIKRLSQFLEIPVARWIQVGREEPIYTLVLTNGQQIKIGGEAAVVDSCRVFARRIYSELHRPLRPITKKEWGTVCKLLGGIVELVDSPETSSREMAMTGIMQYIEQQIILKEDMRDEAIRRGEAWFDKEHLYIYISKIIRYINLHGGGKKWQNGEFVNAIRQAGFEVCRQDYRSNGAHTTKSYWRAPIEQFQEVIKVKHDRK